jgi:hypothetical protein
LTCEKNAQKYSIVNFFYAKCTKLILLISLQEINLEKIFLKKLQFFPVLFVLYVDRETNIKTVTFIFRRKDNEESMVEQVVRLASGGNGVFRVSADEGHFWSCFLFL